MTSAQMEPRPEITAVSNPRSATRPEKKLQMLPKIGPTQISIFAQNTVENLLLARISKTKPLIQNPGPQFRAISYLKHRLASISRQAENAQTCRSTAVDVYEVLAGPFSMKTKIMGLCSSRRTIVSRTSIVRINIVALYA